MTEQKKPATVVEDKATTAPKATTTNPTGKDQIEDSLQGFLRTRALSGRNVRTIVSELNINSLIDLRMTVANPRAMAVLKEKLKDYPVAIEALDALTLEAIDNAIFLSESPGAEARATALRAFLVEHDVLRDQQGWDALFAILRLAGVTSLDSLRAIKAHGATDAKLKALTTKIKNWNPAAATSFASIGVTQVAAASRGGPAKVTPELKTFLQKNGMPEDIEKELADSGVTTLEQLRTVKQDTASGGAFDKLKRRLEDSGIPGATTQLERVQVGDLDREIAEVRTAAGKGSGRTTAQLTQAIKDVEALRAQVEKASEEEFKAVGAAVAAQHKAVVDALHGVSLTDMEAATTAGSKSRDDLVTLLGATIRNATAAKQTLEGIEQTPRSWPTLMTRLSMLSGFLVSPAGTARSDQELVAMPENTERLVRAGGNQRTFSRVYKGSRTESFAIASAEHTSSSLATAAEAGGGAFTGSGVAAVSAAASYADAKQASRESSNFDTATRAECGEVNFTFVPKESIQFDKADIHLSERAVGKLRSIASAQPDDQVKLIRAFYEEFGSHFFMHQVLGGRYQLKSVGRSESSAGKGLLVSAVAQTMKWAAAASASYAGMGGAAKAATSVEGQKSVAVAEGSRYGLNFDSASVEVSTEAVGGVGGTGPRDIWEQSLRFNSTWAVIDRDQPRGVWELVQADAKLSSDLRDLAQLLERVWVREVFLPAVKKGYPALHDYVSKQASITTCAGLNEAVQLYEGEPPLEIKVVTATSGSANHPKAIASTDDDKLKLIGGGAHVEYGNGPGALLTGSYPWGNSWVATAKDHAEASPSTVTAYAIYLHDPFDLWEVKTVQAKSDGRSSRPTITAQLPPEFALTGGGGLTDWDGAGIMLTACGPEQSDTHGGTTHRGWTVKGKDHKDADRGSATAWVIGIRPRNGAEPSKSKVTERHAPRANHAAVDYDARSSTSVIVGGGAVVTWQGPEGGMLTSTGFLRDPQDQVWRARAKDHLKWCDLDLTAWVFTRPGHMA